MKKIDRIREKVSVLPTSLYLSKMHDAGWGLVALEWEREVEVTDPPDSSASVELAGQAMEAGSEQVPFGLRISAQPQSHRVSCE